MARYVIQIQHTRTLEWSDRIVFPDEAEARLALDELLEMNRYGLTRPLGSSVQMLRLVSRIDTVLTLE